MKIAFCSDLHLDHAEKPIKVALAKQIKNSDCDIVVVAGDIAQINHLENELAYFTRRCEKICYIVAGNHEYYTSSMYDTDLLMQSLNSRYKYIKYLPSIGIQELTKDTCLIGWNSMYDCLYGRFSGGRYTFELADFTYIDELKHLTRNQIQGFVVSLGNMLAKHIREVLTTAFSKYKNVIAVTHVPPFPEVCLFNGGPSEIEALPFFCNKQMGDVLLDIMGEYKDNNLTLLAGHTHSYAEKQVYDNFKVIVASARYGSPKVFSYIDV